MLQIFKLELVELGPTVLLVLYSRLTCANSANTHSGITTVNCLDSESQELHDPLKTLEYVMVYASVGNFLPVQVIYGANEISFVRLWIYSINILSA